MIIRCERCGAVTDLKDRAAIQFYVEGGAIKCKKCGEDNRIRIEEDKEGRVS